MSTTALISIISPDRVGLISAVAGRLFELGADIGDTSFAVLGDGAEFAAICDFPDGLDLECLQGEIESLEELDGAEISISHFDLDTSRQASGTITHRIAISGGDRPGLLARLSEVLQQFGANIVRMHAERVSEQYVIRARRFYSQIHLKHLLGDDCQYSR